MFLERELSFQLAYLLPQAASAKPHCCKRAAWKASTLRLQSDSVRNADGLWYHRTA
jgi:hypothetical protein